MTIFDGPSKVWMVSLLALKRVKVICTHAVIWAEVFRARPQIIRRTENLPRLL